MTIEKAKTSKKPKIAIFDLTDCEGCELELVNLREKLLAVVGQVDVANWRLASDNHDTGPFDITFIEGSPIADSDIETIKQARAASKIIVSLGSCAELGGIQSSIGTKGWNEGIKLVYGEKYKAKSKPPKPLSYYIQVDYHIPGCPVTSDELARFLGAVLAGKAPKMANYPVCLECKANENTCLLLEGKPCLGPTTRGGCNALCTTRGLRCWGCFGALTGGNHKSLKKFLDIKFGKVRTEQLFEAFYAHQNEFKEMYPKEK